jgi:hypothetical protein
LTAFYWRALGVWLLLSSTAIVVMTSIGLVKGGVALASMLFVLVVVRASLLGLWSGPWGIDPWELIWVVRSFSTIWASIVVGTGIIGAVSDLRVAGTVGMAGVGVAVIGSVILVPQDEWREYGKAFCDAVELQQMRGN